MMKLTKAVPGGVMVVATALVLGSPVAAEPVGCREVDTDVVGTIGPAPTQSTALIHDGYLKGTLSAEFTITGAAGSSFTFETVGSIVTKHGTVAATATGTLVVTGTTATFEGEGPVTGGTGKFDELTGNLRYSGDADFAAGTFTESITGTVCKVENDDWEALLVT